MSETQVISTLRTRREMFTVQQRYTYKNLGLKNVDSKGLVSGHDVSIVSHTFFSVLAMAAAFRQNRYDATLQMRVLNQSF